MARAARRSGGGELIDQGMHLLDLTHWLAGPLALHSALLRTHFWDTPVEDNAALILGEARSRTIPWAMLHVSWTEWKNLFSLEIYCRDSQDPGGRTGALLRALSGCGSTHGSGARAAELEEIAYPDEDLSWKGEWEHFAQALEAGKPVLGSLEDAHYAWATVQEAYARSPVYAGLAASLKP